MNTIYPTQTRTLIEDVIRIGKVDDPEINTKFLHFYQDSTLQSLINEVEQQYANMTDINDELSEAFDNLKTLFPNLEIPQIYTQIGSLDQSLVVGNNSIGICLDKWLYCQSVGDDEPFVYRSRLCGLLSAEPLSDAARQGVDADGT